MHKCTKKHGIYFTFPLKFLHVPPEKYKERFTLIIRWSIFEMLQREASYLTNNYEKEQWVQEKLNYRVGKSTEWRTDWKELQVLITGGEIYTSVKASYLFDARDGKLNPHLLLLVAAVRSVIGLKRNFCLTNRKTISTRMFGDSERLKRYTCDKLFEMAIGKGMMTRIAAGRGFYVSIRYGIKELEAAIEHRIIKFQTERQNQAEAERKIALIRRNFQY